MTWLRELYRFVVAELDRSFPGGASEAGYYLAITFLVLELLIISVCWLVLGPQRAIAAGAVTPALIVLAMAGLTVVVHKKNGTP